ncbi:MAG: hypothetical protein KAT65_21785, partial [Methanophagales archaeon]|nr:hypothetical protein [Methanophagales archaeon]
MATMRGKRPILAIIGIALLLFTAVLAMATGIANAKPTATRTLPAEPVPADGSFLVEIEVSDYGTFGQVAETLPEGFIYLASTLDPGSVKVFDAVNNTVKVKFVLLGETSFTYTVIAPDSEGTYTFSGILKDIGKKEYEVGGDIEIEVEEMEEEPTATRTLPEEPILGGESFTIEIE